MNQPTTSPEWSAFRAQIIQKTARSPRTKKGQPKTESANALTRKIVSYIRAAGGFATRLQSTGQYRDDLKKFVASQQVKGIPDVMAVINGRAVFVEVKAGRDVLSETQKQTISRLVSAGAAVYICRDFDTFTAWFSALKTLPDDADSLPFGPAPKDQ